MAMAGQFAVEENIGTIPATMQAAVYRGVNDVRLETVPVPLIGAGELLLRVAATELLDKSGWLHCLRGARF